MSSVVMSCCCLDLHVDTDKVMSNPLICNLITIQNWQLIERSKLSININPFSTSVPLI